MKAKLILLIFFLLALAAPAQATVVGWGLNGHSQLGGGYKSGPQGPVSAPPSVSGAVQVVATYFSSYALMPDGTVRAWGGNSYGELGDGVRKASASPVEVLGLTGVTQLAAAGTHAIALRSDGTVATWGGNAWGTLGNGTSGHGSGKVRYSSTVPVHLGLTGVVAVAAGGADDAALLSDGTVVAWGENKTGQLGDGTTIEKDRPTPVKDLSNVRAVALGGVGSHGAHLLALLRDGTVRAAGAGRNGQLGDGGTLDRTTVVAVEGLANVVSVSASSSHSLALLADGRVMAWGSDAYGQLGVKAPEVCPKNPCATRPVATGISATAISAGLQYSLAVSKGEVLAWGRNQYLQLGQGGPDSERPLRLPEVSGVSRISAGEFHSLALGTGPEPVISVRPGPGSLTVTWRSADSKERWSVSWRAVGGKWAPYLALPAATRSHTFAGLPSGQPVEVQVKNKGFGVRTLTATPE